MVAKKTIISNLVWRFFERIGAQGVTLIVSLILARILDPEIYGIVALVTVFTTIMQVFIDGGLGSALIQKKDADDLDFSTVFYFNLIVCVVLYVIMFISSPMIAYFFNISELTSIIRVLSLSLIISGIKNIQQAYVSRNLLFKRFFFATLSGTIGAAILGVWMAYNGFGVWALISQNLFNAFVDTVILWITVKWRPKKCFSIERLKKLYSFGWKLLISNLIAVLDRELRQLVIGKKYSASDLAYYNRGVQFPNLIVINLNSSIDSVLLPTMSAEQDNKSRVKDMTRRAIKTSTFIMMPMMVGLSVCAEPIIRLILTEKWLPAVFFLRIFCFSYAFFPIHTANLNAIKAMGRSDMFLRLEIIKESVNIIALISTMFISVEAMALSVLVTSITSQVINTWPNRRLLDYAYNEQLKDILPNILISGLMGVAVYGVYLLKLSDIITLIIQIPIGVIVYVGLSRYFHVDSYEYVMKTVKNLL